MFRSVVRVFAVLATLSIGARSAHAQLSGETRESARPLSEEGVPRRRPIPSPPPPPPGVVAVEPPAPAPAPSGPRWTLGTGGRVENAATAVGANATLSLTGVTKFEIRGEYSRRTPEGLDGIDGVGGQIKMFLPERWMPGGVRVAGSAEGSREFDVADVWAVKGAVDVDITPNVIVGFTGGYHEKQPELGTRASGFVPSTSLAVIPVTNTEISLQYRLDNDFHKEDRTELGVSQTFPLTNNRWIRVRGSVAKHGTVAFSLSYRP